MKTAARLSATERVVEGIYANAAVNRGGLIDGRGARHNFRNAYGLPGGVSAPGVSDQRRERKGQSQGGKNFAREKHGIKP